MNNEHSRLLLRAKIEELYEYEKWSRELPYLNFQSDWKVKIIPPFCGAIVRFYVTDKDGNYSCSVYFDGYSELGFMYNDDGTTIPYWEIYDGTDIRRYLLGEEEKMMDDIDKILKGELCCKNI